MRGRGDFGFMTDSPNEKRFMREKIVKPPMSRRQVIRRIFCFLLVAVIVGVVAAVSFVISRPMAEKLLGKETESLPIPITIERDDEPGITTTPIETMEETPPVERPGKMWRRLSKRKWRISHGHRKKLKNIIRYCVKSARALIRVL